jgi:hypothetical protein
MREPLQTQPQPSPWAVLACCWFVVFTADLAAHWVWN